jgi:hypothetical protein
VDFIIPSEILGTDFSLIVKDDGSYTKYDPGQKLESRTINVKAKGVRERAKLYGLDLPIFPPARFRKPYEHILGKPENIPWTRCIPKGLYRKALEEYISEIRNLLTADFSYYNHCYLETEPLFSGLEPAVIDIEKFNEFLEDGDTSASKAILKSFAPVRQEANGQFFTDSVVYSRTSSKTGRLKVVKGPGILHVKTSYRNILKSRYQNGGIFYFDFTSLEPRTLLAIRKPDENIPKDIYEHTLKTLDLVGAVDRQHVKTALISTINGAGEKEIARQLEGKVDYPEDFIRAITEHFGIEELRETLADEYAKNDGKLIYNYYDRPILCEHTPPYILLNYYIQSTAVDIAMLGFNMIYDKLISSNAIEYCKPIFILHDALVLDVAPDIFHLLEKLALVGTKITKLENTHFWIDIERLDKEND